MQLLQTKPCTATPTAQSGAKDTTPSKPKAEPFGLKSIWLHFTNKAEVRRLAKLHVRIETKKSALAEVVAERQIIMNRCIRRMRRASGKN